MNKKTRPDFYRKIKKTLLEKDYIYTQDDYENRIDFNGELMTITLKLR